MADFKWTNERHRAAQLLADGKLTDEQIATELGVSAQTIRNWRAYPAFAGRVEELVADFARAVRRRGIAVLERRVAALNDRWLRMQQVIEARAADPTMQVVPGGPTGLLVHTVKGVGRGEDFQLIDLYEVDTGLLNELRQHEKQAAQELGQWTERKEIGGDPEKPLVVKQLKNVSADDL
jgi:ParB-like chromosome segregation protein Spo0J